LYLIHAKAVSMGLYSGEYAGRKRIAMGTFAALNSASRRARR